MSATFDPVQRQISDVPWFPAWPVGGFFGPMVSPVPVEGFVPKWLRDDVSEAADEPNVMLMAGSPPDDDGE